MGDDMTAAGGIPDPDLFETTADFHRGLQALRDRARLTIREVAEQAGGGRATVGDYFSGKHLPLDRKLLARILAVCGEVDPERIERWQVALTRVRKLPGPRRADPPYLGLARYEAADATRFFGREDVTGQLASLAAMQSELPLLVIGPSGAGKSSVLRAGLLPHLDEAGWTVTVIDLSVTEARELTELAVKLAAPTESPAAGTGDDVRHAVVVDQFESAFTLCADRAEQDGLIGALCALARGTLVVLALRADYYGQAIRYPRLRRALQERHVVVGPMTAEQVREAVVRPARLARADVDDGLVALLLADLAPADEDGGAAHDPGALPLLSHAMLATWKHSRGGTLSVADYQASGGIRNALTQTAERAYESLNDTQRELARPLFLRLVHVADDVPPSRSSVALGDLPGWGQEGDAERVLAAFVGERMITVDADAAQITHDALLAAWPRLRSWIEDSAGELRDRGRISAGAQAWAEADQEDAALWRGSRLALAREWAADHGKRAALPSQALPFVDACVAAGAASELAARRRTSRLQVVIAMLVVLVLAVAGLSGYAFHQQAAADSAASLADSHAVAFAADQLRAKDPAVAAQLSVSAGEFAPSPQAAASLLESSGAPSVARIRDAAGIVQWVTVSPDRRLLAATGDDGSLRLWNVALPGRPTLASALTQAGGKWPLYVAEFSPNGKLLAAAGPGPAVTLWEMSGSRATRLHGPIAGKGDALAIAFSPDSATLAVASRDGTVRLWDVSDPARATADGAPLVIPKSGTPDSVAFSPDGAMLAAGSTAGTAWLWRVPSRASLAAGAAPAPLPGMPLTGPAAEVSGVAFSPDGHEIAASSKDEKVWLWRVRAGHAVPDGTLTGATDWVNTVAFSPDGRSVAAGTSSANVLVWSLATRALSATLPHPLPVTSVAWDGPDRIAAGGADGTICLWSLPPPVLATDGPPTSVAYSPDGHALAVGASSVQLWNARSHALLARHALPSKAFTNATVFRPAKAGDPLIATAISDGTVALLDGRTLAPVTPAFTVTEDGAAESVAFSPDGRLLATGADDGTVRLFDVTNPVRPRQLTVAREPGSSDSIYTVVFAPDGTTIAAASTGNAVQLWRVTSRHGLSSAGPDLGGMSSYPIGLAFTADGQTLAIGNADRHVYLWDVANSAHPRRLGVPLTGPSGNAWAVAISPDGTILAVGANDGTAWLWNLATPAHPALIATLTGMQAHVFSVAFSPDGTQLAAASYDDNAIRQWDTSPAIARAAICANLGQPLSPAEWADYMPEIPYRMPCS
jgi:WD40 repeat protein/transcriptional regulator with XRE-family HTH domain